MIAPNDIASRTKEIRDMFSEGQVGQALKRLMDFMSDFSEDRGNLNEVVVISSNFRNLEAAERRERISYKEARQERSQLLFQALELLDAVIDGLGGRVS